MAQKISYRRHGRMGIGLIEYTGEHSMGSSHYHDTYEIYLQLEGERYITIENESCHLVKGDLVVIEPYAIHMTESRDSTYCRRYLMNIYTPLMRTLLSQEELDSLLANMHTCAVHLSDKSFDRAYHILGNIYSYFCRNDPMSKKLMYAAMFELLDFIAGLHASPMQNGSDISETNPVSIALKYIHTNYAENISLDFIADMVNMSKSNFCLVFRKAVGKTIVEYINHVRISHAHRLVCETRLPIKVIAEQTGFNTPSYMISVFKKINGITPNELRKETIAESRRELPSF